MIINFLIIIQEKMSIKIQSFGGPVVWGLRKYCSGFTSKILLAVTGKIYERKINRYIHWFTNCQKTPPFKFLMFETINRCNGLCAFCPANRNAEKRPYKRMSEETFLKVIRELKEVSWQGTIFLQVNNEPFIDTRMLGFTEIIKKELSGCKVCIITNGTLLSQGNMNALRNSVDELIINDYSNKYRLSKNLKEIYNYLKKNKNLFDKMEVSFRRRYSEEILATRAGNAPNKPQKVIKMKFPCIYPFTDFVIWPDGKVGMCCNDCYEVTDFGNVNSQNIFEIWQGEKFRALREAMKEGRDAYAFCKECDVVDAGSREKIISQ